MLVRARGAHCRSAGGEQFVNDLVGALTFLFS